MSEEVIVGEGDRRAQWENETRIYLKGPIHQANDFLGMAGALFIGIFAMTAVHKAGRMYFLREEYSSPDSNLEEWMLGWFALTVLVALSMHSKKELEEESEGAYQKWAAQNR